jgi:F-type H+-transporting ATPase subunit b
MFVLAFAESVQLMPDFSMFIHMAMILGMIWILNRTFFRPINRILDSRERNKGGQSTEAKELLSQAVNKESAYRQGLLETRNESYELIEKERSEAMKLKQGRVAEVKQEVATMLETELNELDNQTNTAREAIAKEAEKMADKISSNILKTA